MKVGKSIQDIRKQNGLSQEQFGVMFHVTRQTVSNWENEKSYPDLQTLIAISDKFDISLDKLLKEDPHMVKTIDEERKRVKMITLFLTGFLPFVTGWFVKYWDYYIPLPVWGYVGSLLWLAIWGFACYKVASPERKLYLQIVLLNLPGVVALIESVLVQFEIIECLRFGQYVANTYLDHAILYPFGVYIKLIENGIIDPWKTRVIPEFVYISIVAWLIMVLISVTAIVLKVKGYRFKLDFQMLKKEKA